MRRTRAGWLALLLAIGLALPGIAEAKGTRGKDGQGKRQVVRFDGDEIDGARTRPDGELSAVRPPVDPPSLVQAPGSFARASRRTLMSAADAAGGDHAAHGSEARGGTR